MKVVCRANVQAKSISNLPYASDLIKIREEKVVLAIRIEPDHGPYVLIEYAQNKIAWFELAGFECVKAMLPEEWTFFGMNNETWATPPAWATSTFFRALANDDPVAWNTFKVEALKIYEFEGVAVAKTKQH